MFNLLDQELQRELIEFCKREEEDKSPKQLNYALIAELLRQLASGNRQITGMLTNHKTGDVFVRFSFKE